jgi:hypothetical protein
MEQPTLLADLYEFVTLHRSHGELRAVAGEATPNGYRLEVACACHVVFETVGVPQRRRHGYGAAGAVELSNEIWRRRAHHRRS